MSGLSVTVDQLVGLVWLVSVILAMNHCENASYRQASDWQNVRLG